MDHEDLTLLRHWADRVAMGQTHDSFVWDGRIWRPIAPIVRLLVAQLETALTSPRTEAAVP